MYRLIIFIIACGGMLFYYGWNEYTVSSGTTATPVTITLADLENGTIPDSNYIQIDTHWRLHSDTVYSYKRPKSASGDEVKPSYTVTYAYYPVISEEHPYFETVADLLTKHGSLSEVPQTEWPKVDKFSVLVKTDTFETIGDIPDGWEEHDTLTGLIINRISSLSDEEKSLIQGSFPKLDVSKLLILEEGRKPLGQIFSLGSMGGGVVLMIVGLIMGYQSYVRRNA